MTWYLWTGGAISLLVIAVLIIRRRNGNSGNVFDRGSRVSRNFMDCCIRFLKGGKSEA